MHLVNTPQVAGSLLIIVKQKCIVDSKYEKKPKSANADMVLRNMKLGPSAVA